MLQKILCISVDTLSMMAAFLFAFLFRMDFQEPFWGWSGAACSFLVVWIVQVAALAIFGCYRTLWRFTSLADLPQFLGAVLTSSFVLLLFRFFTPNIRWLRPPYGVILLNSFFVFCALMAVRLLVRIFLEQRFTENNSNGKIIRILVIGAGDGGDLAVRELKRLKESTFHVVGFLDDDPAKAGAMLQGCKVLGNLADLPRVLKETKPQQVLVAIAKASREKVRKIVEECEPAGVSVKILPSYDTLLQGKFQFARIRNVEVSDLLGRDESQVDAAAAIKLLGSRRVMVTGAGGSIGSELVRQVLQCGPQILLMVERNEFALYRIDHEIRKLGLSIPVIPLLADIGDDIRMEQIFSKYHPDIIIHAAAHKHVPMMELNPCEAIKNNVLATRRLGELAIRHSVKRFVLISTDKAVKPVSVMGMSKRLAEVALQDLNRKKVTLFSAVRFGNVLDSSGSVVPLFREQIRNGGPVTVTHPEMKRYFMTISEAVSLVLQATTLAKGGEIFVLDMGEPIPIVKLAETMISLSGFRPFEDIPIEFTGIRPGEKLFEELDVSERSAYKTGHARIFISKIGTLSPEKVSNMLTQCAEMNQETVDATQIRGWLEELER